MYQEVGGGESNTYPVMPCLAVKVVYQKGCGSIRNLAMPRSLSGVPRGGWRREEYVSGQSMSCCASGVSKSVWEHT